jgi:hypothetical protein
MKRSIGGGWLIAACIIGMILGCVVGAAAPFILNPNANAAPGGVFWAIVGIPIGAIVGTLAGTIALSLLQRRKAL